MSEDACSFTYRPDNDEPDQAPDSPFGNRGEGECSLSPYKDEDVCIFHLEDVELSPEERREVFLQAVEEDKEFLGIDFGILDLGFSDITTADNETIRFRGCTFEEGLNFHGANISVPIEFRKCVFECTNHGLHMAGEFDGYVSFVESYLDDGGLLDGAMFHGGLSMLRTEVDGIIEFGGASGRSMEFTNCEFSDILSLYRGEISEFVFAGCTVNGELDVELVDFEEILLNGTDFDSVVGFEDVSANRIQVDDSMFADGIAIIDSEVEEVEFTSDSPNKGVSFQGTTISSGKIDSSPNTQFNLTEATVGDISLKVTSEEGLDQYLFLKTNFDGFEFAEYRDALRKRNWKIHGYNGDDGYELSDIELTYLKAKRGAGDIGDSDVASEFFINEMRYRRKQSVQNLRSSENSIYHRIKSIGYFLHNGILDLIAGYGEKPTRVIGAAFITIVGCALIYPAIGTFEGYSYSQGLNVGAFLTESLYFSIVTFSTLGYGDITPEGWVRLLAASEAVGGAFLMALFVFTLGRQVHR